MYVCMYVCIYREREREVREIDCYTYLFIVVLTG